MRYLFRGRRKTGEPVEGHVTAASIDAAGDTLNRNGIVADTIEAAAAPEPRDVGPSPGAVDAGGLRVSFDHLSRGYQAKSGCAIEQERLRKLMTTLADGADGDGHDDARQAARVELVQVLKRILQDRRNTAAAAQSPALEAQVSRLTGIVGKIERAMASMSAPTRHGQPRREPAPTSRNSRHDAVLLEIFESNLELIRGLEEPAGLPARTS